MLAWRDEAILLAARRHGEADAIVEMLTAGRGRHCGVVKGGAGRRQAATLQPGNQLDAEWRARLESHIGTARVEVSKARAGSVMADAGALAALTSAAALLIALLPEREPHPALYRATVALFDALAEGGPWPTLYAHWEVGLLGELGYGLDLDSCAATGATEDLIWVSPKSGRAVSRGPGAPYADRLLPLPAFLRTRALGTPAEIADALRLTGHFLGRALAATGAKGPPPARARLVDRLSAPVSR
jgi:DNA repair protein RecO (recombination protein O)